MRMEIGALRHFLHECMETCRIVAYLLKIVPNIRPLTRMNSTTSGKEGKHHRKNKPAGKMSQRPHGSLCEIHHSTHRLTFC